MTPTVEHMMSLMLRVEPRCLYQFALAIAPQHADLSLVVGDRQRQAQHDQTPTLRRTHLMLIGEIEPDNPLRVKLTKREDRQPSSIAARQEKLED